MTAKNEKIFNETGKRQKFFIRTYGCQMNSRDSEKMTALLLQIGYEKAETSEEADFILFNTCCVRESAEDKVFGHISRLKNEKIKRPNLIIGICGCMTQQSEIAKKFEEKYSYVNLVFGTSNRQRLPEFIWQTIETGKPVINITEDEGLPEIEDVPVTVRDYPHKAGVNIMFGCDNFCAYCIVPHVRGREKSRPSEDIINEIKSLAKDGVKEIMILGQNVNSYGKGLLEETTFPKLLRKISEIDGIKRIRFMTSHPKDFSDELISVIKDLKNVCKHVHLPLQSGSTKVLTDMNRKYTKEKYQTLVKKIQTEIPEIALTTDIIVGYPGETEEDFIDTLEVVKTTGFSGAFTFIYSKRSGTPAAKRKDLVPKKEVNHRFDRLTETLYPIMESINENKVGKVFKVMVEEENKGRLDDHTLVHFTSDKSFNPGDIINVEITSAKTFYVTGKTIAPKEIH